jgi:hypothetical protein
MLCIIHIKESLLLYVYNTVRSESHCALIKGVGSDVHKCLYSEDCIKQLHTLPVVHFNRCLTTEYSETTAHCNGNLDADNPIYIPYPKLTATFQTHCI